MNKIEKIFRSESQKIWRTIFAFSKSPQIANETVSEVFAQALSNKNITNPEAWIWSSSFKIAKGLLAKSNQETQLISDCPQETYVPLYEILDTLSPLTEQQQKVIILRYVSNLKPRHIAEILETTSESVRTQLHRAHKILKEHIELGE